MRIEITLNSYREVTVTKSYNHTLQSLIYGLIDAPLSQFLHDRGYLYGKRKFKLFTFSRLLGSHIESGSQFRFFPPIRLVISSPRCEILETLARRVIAEEKLLLGRSTVFVDSVSVIPKPSFSSGEAIVRMLSPVTIYSTIIDANGRKRTYYYSPFEEEFSRLVSENLRKKYEVNFQEKLPHCDFTIEPYIVNSTDQKVIIYQKPRTYQSKPTVIKGWMGLYKLKGDPRVIELSYDAGLGAKNSLGFGCWEKVG